MKKQLLQNQLLNISLTTMLSISMSLISNNNVFSQQADTSLLKLLDMDMEKILELQQGGRGDAGGFGQRLGSTFEYGEDVKFGIHGYVSNEYYKLKSYETFDQHYFNVFVSGQIGKKLFAEIQFEYEHSGKEVGSRYAQLDWKLHDLLVIRTGQFIVPISVFNEYLYPEYINKAISRPYTNFKVIPAVWTETGLQFRGQKKIGDFIPNYALYIVNGLQGPEGASTRNLRYNDRDKKHSNKAVGGKVGLMYKGLEFSGGAYNGKYTEDGKLGLTLGAADLIYKTKSLTMHATYSMLNMEKWVVKDTTKGMINRGAASVQVSYIIKKRFEPIVRYDFVDFDNDWDTKNKIGKDKTRVTIGLNYLITNTANLKVSYEIINGKEGELAKEDFDDNDVLIGVQLAIGF